MAFRHCLLTLLTLLSGLNVLVQAQVFDRRQRAAPELIIEANGRTAACDVIVFTRDGQHLLAAGDDKVIRIWEVGDRKLEPVKALRWKTWRERRGAIYALALSPDAEQRFVAVGGLGVYNGGLAVFDRFTGQVVHGLTGAADPAQEHLLGFTVWSLDFSPDGKKVVAGAEDGTIWVWDLASGVKNDVRALGRHAPNGPTNFVRLVAFLDANRILSVAQDGAVLEWDARRAGPPAERFRLSKTAPILCATLSPDRTRLAACGEVGLGRTVVTTAAEIWPLTGGAGQEISAHSGRRVFPHRLAFDTTGQRLALAFSARDEQANFHSEIDSPLHLYDLSNGVPKLTARWTVPLYAEALAFQPDGQRLAVASSNDYAIALYTPDGQVTAQAPVPGHCLWGVGLSADGRYLGVQSLRAARPDHPNRRGAGPWQVFDLERRDWAGAKAPPFQPVPPRDTEGGWTVHTVHPTDPRAPKNSLQWYVQGPGGQVFPLPWNPLDLHPRCYTFLPPQAGQPVRLAVGHYWGVSLFDLTAQGPRRSRLYVGHQGEVMALAPSADGRLLVSASRDMTVACWSLAPWEHHPELGAAFETVQGKVRVKDVDPGSPAWEAGLTRGDGIKVFKVGVNQFIYDQAKATPTAEDCLKRLAQPVPGVECYFELERAGQAGTVKTLTTVRQRPVWRFFPSARREWVLWRWQDFFYDTSTNGDYLIGWTVCGDADQTPVFHKAEQFRDKYHQPDKLAGTLLARTPVRPDRPAFRDEEPPAVRLTADGPPQGDRDLTVTLTIQPQGTAEGNRPTRVLLWVNDYQFKTWPQPGDGWEKDGAGYRCRLTIPKAQFRAGANQVALQCYNAAGHRSPPARVDFRCTRPPGPMSLYGLTVGISRFGRTAPYRGNVIFPDVSECESDAKLVRQLWEAKANKPYQEVKIVPLLNEAATPAAILDHIRGLADRVKPEDLFVFFIACHGYADGILQGSSKARPGTFTLVTPTFDWQRPAQTGLTSQALYEALAVLPCRKLLLINACHSGDPETPPGSERIYSDPARDLTRDGIGPVVLAACKPTQQAYVHPIDGIGLFTKAVAAALDADFTAADANKDGVIDTRELAQFVQDQVAKLARDLAEQQDPTASPLPQEEFAVARK